MTILALARLMQQVLQAGRPSRKSRKPDMPARSKRASSSLAVEELEGRLLLSTLEAISLELGTQPPSASAAGTSLYPTVSADARYLAFQSSASNLFPEQADAGEVNVFLLDRNTGQMRLVSHLPGNPLATPATGLGRDSYRPLISADGRYVVYTTTAEELAGPTQGGFPYIYTNVMVYDRTTDQNTLVSHSSSSPTVGGTADSELEAISADGRYIVYHSRASDLVPNQVTAATDPKLGLPYYQLYVYDQQTGTTSLVSHAVGQVNVTGDHEVTSFGAASVADDGTVAYISLATNLVAPATSVDSANVYLYSPGNRANQLISTVSGSTTVGGGGAETRVVISGDGQTVVYTSTATNLVPNQTNALGHANVYRYNTLTGTTLVSGVGGSATDSGNNHSGNYGYGLAVSHDGQLMTFTSEATDLISGQLGAASNVFLYDVSGSSLTLVSGVNGSPTNGAGGVPVLDTVGRSHNNLNLLSLPNSRVLSMSSDGSWVAYLSAAEDILNGQRGPTHTHNVFLYDGATGSTTLVSRSGGSPTTTGLSGSGGPVLSATGNLVAFPSQAVDLSLDDLNGSADVFTYTRGSQAIALVSQAKFQVQKSGDSFSTSVSADGRYTVFTSTATNLVPNQVPANAVRNIFVYDKQTKEVRLVNHIPGLFNTTGDGGIPLDASDSPSERPPTWVHPVISADGNLIAFTSTDMNLVPNESFQSGGRLEHFYSVYLYDVQSRQITLVNHLEGMPSIVNNNVQAWNPVISKNGDFVAFVYGGFGNEHYQTVLYDRVADTLTEITPEGTRDTGPSSNPSISDDGSLVAFQNAGDVFVFDRTTGTTTLVSHASGSPGTSANASSQRPALSHDGSMVAFVSQATNLVPGQVPSAFSNVFLFDVASGTVSLVSGAGGSTTVGGNGNSDSPAISGDGDYVAYRSDATNLVPGQVGGGSNIFQYNRLARTQALISHQANAPTTAAAGDSTQPVIDDDGHLVSYVSIANNLIPGQSGPAGVKNVFLWLRQTNANILASGQDGSPTLTGNADSDGPLLTRQSFPSFSSTATNLLPGVGGSSVAYINTLVSLTLSPNTIASGSPAGTVVGTLIVSSLLAGQFLPPVYSLPANEVQNAAFQLGNPGNDALVTKFVANYAGQATYVVNVHVDIGLGDHFGTLTVNVAAALPLMVTIDQAADQVDPSSAQTIHFTVVFSQPVTDFTAADVALGGTAGASAVAVTGSGNTYDVAVSGMTQSGTVTASIAAGVASNGAGIFNSASISSDNMVSYNAPPQVSPPANLEQIALQFTHSTEYFRYFLTQAYLDYVNRAPDEDYLQVIIPQMQSGLVSDEYIEALFIGAPEYIQKKGGTDLQWLNSMYLDLLFRQPRPEEIDYWTQRLAEIRQAHANDPGYNVNVQAAFEFDRSAEREGHRIQGNYEAYLGRMASADEVNYWVNRFLLLNQTSEELGAGFIASDEYFNKFNKGRGDRATWVRAAYLDVLHREAAAGEVDYWLGQVQ